MNATRTPSSGPVTPAAGRSSSLPAVLALAALACGAGSAWGDQILQVYGTSVTAVKFTAATAGQNVRMRFDQSGVNLDGSLRAGGGYAWALNGNPFEGGVGGATIGSVRLATGTFAPTEIDVALPSAGASRVVIGRSFNARQDVSAAHHDSSGPQGINWFQMSQPEIAFFDNDANSGTKEAADLVYVVYGADRYVEFKRTAVNDDTFQGRNGSAGVIKYVAGGGGQPDTFLWYDQHGTITYFFGGNTGSGHGDWQFWKIVDPAGNVAYVGDAATASTAVTNGYSSKMVQKLYDGAGRRYCMSYATATGDSRLRLTQVVVETDAGGGWGNCGAETLVAQVDYAYYQTGDTTYGDIGNLKLVTVTTPLTDSGVSLVRKKLYRYWVGAYNASTNPGHANTLKYIIDYEGYRNYDWTQDSNLDDDPQAASNANLDGYAAAYFEYDSSYRLTKAFFNGECGCGGGNNGLYEFVYGTGSNYATAIANTSYDNGANDWSRTVVEQPDSMYVTQYFDETGQPLSQIMTDATPADVFTTDMWVTQVIRNGSGQVTEVRSPAANDDRPGSSVYGYTHSTAAFTSSASAGLIALYNRVSGTDVDGFLEFVTHKKGTGGTEHYDAKTTYDDPDLNIAGSVDVTRPLIAGRRSYHVVDVVAAAKDTAANFHATAYTNAYWSNTNTDVLYITLKQVTTTLPAVDSGNNGSGSSLTSDVYLRKDGTAAFTVSTGGRFDYTRYSNGRLVHQIDDAMTSGTFESGDDPNTDWGITESGDGVNRVTSVDTYGSGGWPARINRPDGTIERCYFSRLADHRWVSIRIPRITVDGSGDDDEYFGPASYHVFNHSGQVVFGGTIAITSAGITDALSTWIDETDADPITALDKGTLVRMATAICNKAGTRVEERRSYFDIPASGTGSDGTNYDATTYGFDDMGRRRRVVEPSGTIARTVYTERGQVSQRHVGTNDYSFAGGSGSGPDNMVKTDEVVYDTNADGGNGHATTSTAFIQDSTTGQRVTTYVYDLRGRVLLETNPQSPHVLIAYDNFGRETASGLYSSTGSITPGTTNPAYNGTQTDRIGLSRTYFDELGRVWKSEHYKIDQSDGSDDDTLQTLTWYDPEGRVMKEDGEQLTKTRHDRLGRVTHRWTLAKDNDSQYGHASANTAVWDTDDKITSIAGDHVLEERQTTYESTDSDNVVMTAVIERFHDDLANGTTGALDTNADGNTFKYTAADVDGRIQISATWFDDWNRAIDTVNYGTYGGADFDRKPSAVWLTAPARSDTALRTTYSYNDDGTVLQVEDPRALETRYGYDDRGRKTSETRNYVNGSPSGSPDYDTCTDDNVTRYAFTDGLMTHMWVDLRGDDTDGVPPVGGAKQSPADDNDQVTTYIYGSTKATPTPMKTASGHLLRAVKYPDTANSGTTLANIDSDSSDVASFAYNAQGQLTYVKDQEAGIIETDYDTGGRETQRRVSTLDGSFDGAVRRIATTYVARGMVEKVTQYDDPDVGDGSVVDDVKHVYDGWGNLTNVMQDVDSDLDVSPAGRASFEVAYTYAKNTSGRNTLRRTQRTLPGNGFAGYTDYVYTSSGNCLDNDASRLTQLDDFFVAGVALYHYNGVATLVGTTLNEPDVMWKTYTSSGNYPDFDIFNRITSSRWTKDLATDRDFVDFDVAYDRNGNITRVEDNVHATGLLGAGNGLFDVAYSIDDLDRLTRAKEGHWGGSAVADGDTKRDQIWTLTQTGNWELDKLDLDGDLNYNEAGELNDDRTHNAANELTARDTDDNGSNNYTQVHDADGNMTDDGQRYEYVYDAFGRVKQVKNTTNQNPIAVYRYNGLGFRISYTYDTDSDNDIDGSDTTYHFCHDEQWRVVAVFRGSDTYAKERFVPHVAGLGGYGGSSYIDAVILRDRDANTAWGSAADSTTEERRYYCQNWREDASAIVTDLGKMVEWVKYSSYGNPHALPSGDTDSDHDWDATDSAAITGSYDIRKDAELDGDVDANDVTQANSITSGYQTIGRGGLSSSAVANRKGYAGYEKDAGLAGTKYHVRHRVLDSELGRWTARDVLSYADGPNLYAFVRSNPIMLVDPFGLTGGPPKHPAEGKFTVGFQGKPPPAGSNWWNTTNTVQPGMYASTPVVHSFITPGDPSLIRHSTEVKTVSAFSAGVSAIPIQGTNIVKLVSHGIFEEVFFGSSRTNKGESLHSSRNKEFHEGLAKHATGGLCLSTCYSGANGWEMQRLAQTYGNVYANNHTHWFTFKARLAKYLWFRRKPENIYWNLWYFGMMCFGGAEEGAGVCFYVDGLLTIHPIDHGLDPFDPGMQWEPYIEPFDISDIPQVLGGLTVSVD